MPFYIVRQDITKMKVDAIVNAANNSLLGGGGVDGAIHAAAGPELLKECATLHGCATGEAKITKAYNLPCKYVVHTVGPIWGGGMWGEDVLLKSCYAKSLALAKQNGAYSIACPLISSGAYRFPKERAVGIATEAIKEFLDKEDASVYLVIYDRDSFVVSKKRFAEVKEYIDDNYIGAAGNYVRRRRGYDLRNSLDYSWEEGLYRRYEAAEAPSEVCKKPVAAALDLNAELKNLDEGFKDMLFRLIDEKGLTDVECYKKANIDKKVFSKIRSNANYKPSKTTAVAFAVALELPLSEAKRLIELAGFSLTHNNKFDVIIEYYIKSKQYDIFKINETLFEFDQKLLGC